MAGPTRRERAVNGVLLPGFENAYTGLLNAGNTSNPLAGEHEATEEALRASGIPVTILRNGWYIENYTQQLGQYLERGEIAGATANGKISAAARADFAVAAAAALLTDEGDEVVHELGGPAFTLDELAATISDVTGTKVAHRDLSAEEFTAELQQAGLDAGTAGFVAGIDASIAAGDLHTDSEDLAGLLGRPTTPLADAVHAAHS